MAVTLLTARNLANSPDIVSEVQTIPANPAIALLGGFALTGFIDIEKEIFFRDSANVLHTFFLEKKLPFQVLVLDVDPTEEESASKAPAE
jgi:hypothetical protein